MYILGKKSGIPKRNKTGLSTVIANLLLILLVMIAIAIVWIVIQNILTKGSQSVNITQLTLSLSIKYAYFSGTNLLVSVKRNSGPGAMTGIRFVFTNATQSVTVDRNVSMTELQTEVFTFTPSEIPGIGPGDQVSIAPIYLISGNQQISNPTDTAQISGTPPTGQGQLQQSTSCNNNNIIDTGELCDGSQLNGENCTDFGYAAGNLTCDNTCNFNTSGCFNPPPACNGTWDGQIDINAEDQCDGTPLPHGCNQVCECDYGFTSDGNGGCSLNSPLNFGSIRSVWNNIFIDSSDLPENSSVSYYIGKYINFSNSPETGCFLIDFASYIENNSISYLRVAQNNGTIAPDITAGQNYNIWEAANCGQE